METSSENQMDDEKTTILVRKKYWEDVKTDTERQFTIVETKTSTVEDETSPEIKDIYDHIYGNVHNKLVFYEGKHKYKKVEEIESPKNEKIQVFFPESPTIIPLVENHCAKCYKAEFISDRSEVLTEINANLKLELEYVKRDMKAEHLRNNQLNYEIANIEAALEQYYKEAKHQKSTLSSIYSAMKNYVSSDDKTDEDYTFKRIKMIADYIESLKNKLEHQDRIIKNDFIENPYYTDLIIKHEAILKQLDDTSKVNEELKSELHQKNNDDIEIIKELNRQKFQVEMKCTEMQNRHKEEIAKIESEIESVEDKYKNQLVDIQATVSKKDAAIAKMERICDARVHNYKQELVIVYRKWKEQKLLNNGNNK